MNRRTLIAVISAICLATVIAAVVVVNRPAQRTRSTARVAPATPASSASSASPTPPVTTTSASLSDSLASFVGRWGHHEASILIDGSGAGHYDYADLDHCDGCSFAAAPRGTVDFALASATNGLARGTVVGVMETPYGQRPPNYTVGEPVTLTLTAGVPNGVVLQMTIGAQQLLDFCNDTSTGECGS